MRKNQVRAENATPAAKAVDENTPATKKPVHAEPMARLFL